MEDIFGPNGLLALHLQGYEPRPGQQEMAAAVFDLLSSAADMNEEEPIRAQSLVVEAETGLGKTLAYLIPAVLSGRRVVISTNTRNLQDQILKREVPFIREYIEPHLEALCVKGRQNYLCLYRWQQLYAGQGELFDDSAGKRLAAWIEQTRFADRAELDWLPAQSPLWQNICCQSQFCLGSDCPEGSRCFLNRLRREAAASRLLVVNHHLLFSDLAVRQGGYGEVLPRYETVVFDEAHHVENVASQFFGRSFSRFQIIDLTADLERSCLAELNRKERENLLKKIHALSGRMEQFSSFFPSERGRFPLRELLVSGSGLMDKRDGLLRALGRLEENLDEIGRGEELWAQYSLRCRDLLEQLEFITAEHFDDLPENENRYIEWFERKEKNLILSATPVDVSEELQASLFSSVAACVFTSATLTTGGNFSYFFQRMGLPEETPALSFSSPFDYAQQTRLYVPGDDFPEPADQGYQKALHENIDVLIRMADGRALVLFTSFKALEAAWHALEGNLSYPLLRQGEAPRYELLRRFSSQTDTVLFAVASFWEGVDIPGESLSLVIIDKLPFEVPSDPVIMARMNRIKAEGGNPFHTFQVPRAILTLRQGVGRLMRSTKDCGVIAILDVRLFSKGYGKRFRGSLPPSPVVRELGEVERFFKQIKR